MGQLTLELPKTLEQELALRAQEEGVSLQQYILYALTRQIGRGYHLQVVSPNEVKEQRERYDHLLASLGRAATLAETEAFLASRELAEPEEGLSQEIIDRLQTKMAHTNQPTP